MMIERRDTISSSTLLRSMWSWDLWLALLFGLIVAVVSITLDFQPKRTWIAPLLGVSCMVLAIAVKQRTNLRNRLRGSNYGELLRIMDQTETEARMPYSITIWVAVASIICSAPMTIVIESVCQKWAIVALLTLLTIVFVWSCAALLSVLRLSGLHDDHEAWLEAQKEELQSAQREYEAEQRRKSL